MTMQKRKHLLSLFAFLFLLACSRDEVRLDSPQNGSELGDPLTKAELDRFILDRLQEGDEVFRWEWMNDHQLWSAAVRSDSVMAIGYKPAAEGDIRERMHEFDLQKSEWNEARQQIIDLVVGETNRLYPGRDYSLQDLLAFPENPDLPIIDLRIFNEEIVTALRRMPEVRYVEPIGYHTAAVRDRSDSGCGVTPSYSISGDFTTVSPGSKVPWNFYNMNIPTAWNTSQGDNITIAVIDTGSGDNQENLGSEFNNGWSGGRFIDRVSTLINGWWWWATNEGPHDQCGHGTQMAGLAVAPRDTDGNSIGVAYKANLLSIRAHKRVEMTSATKINTPPIVGVPDLMRWVCGPHSRTVCVTSQRLTRRMNQPPKKRTITSEVRNAPPTRKVMY